MIPHWTTLSCSYVQYGGHPNDRDALSTYCQFVLHSCPTPPSEIKVTWHVTQDSKFYFSIRCKCHNTIIESYWFVHLNHIINTSSNSWLPLPTNLPPLHLPHSYNPTEGFFRPVTLYWIKNVTIQVSHSYSKPKYRIPKEFIR